MPRRKAALNSLGLRPRNVFRWNFDNFQIKGTARNQLGRGRRGKAAASHQTAKPD